MEPAIVNNLKIYPFKSKDEILEYVIDKHKILIALNAEKILKEDERLKKIINENIGYPDGVGAVMALKKKGFEAAKIPGVELWHDIIERYHKQKSFYLIGSTDEVIETTVKKLKLEFPGIDIKNYRNGYLKEGDLEVIKNDLQEKKPDVVFVAMGSPKQEFVMEELLKSYPALYQGLGGSFDVYSGKVKRAPEFFQKTGLEWFYRLLKQPTRIKRQIVYIKFMIKLTLNTL